MDAAVGSKLREARTRRRLSLHQVEEQTKIRARYLQAIEAEDWDQLPGDTYARAFVRAYAAIVGLDGERLAEELRQARGAARPGERLPRVDPKPRRVARMRRRRRLPPRLVTAGVVALVTAALIAVVLLDGSGGERGSTAAPEPALGKARAVAPAGSVGTGAGSSGHSLKLLATGEVWVCLLDGHGTPLVAGATLARGETEGPFRSGSFTLALGNGAMKMTLDGKAQKLPEPAGPIGFRVDPGGSVRELPEGERPTCT